MTESAVQDTGLLVTLDADELAVASLIGCRRNIACIRAKSDDVNFPDRENIRWQTHIDGACAELAVCKALGIYWIALSGPTAEGDVGRNIQVRSTRYADGHLIIRSRDSDNARYVLVTCRAPAYVVAGWMTGTEAKTDMFLRTNDRDPRPFWEVPQIALHPFRPGRE